MWAGMWFLMYVWLETTMTPQVRYNTLHSYASKAECEAALLVVLDHQPVPEDWPSYVCVQGPDGEGPFE